MNYEYLINMKLLYDDTSQETIKSNIKRLMTKHEIKHGELTEILSISMHTAYSYTNKANSNKPELFNLMLIASYVRVEVAEFFTH